MDIKNISGKTTFNITTIHGRKYTRYSADKWTETIKKNEKPIINIANAEYHFQIYINNTMRKNPEFLKEWMQCKIDKQRDAVMEHRGVVHVGGNTDSELLTALKIVNYYFIEDL